jgi:DNA repair protein RadC
MLIDTPTADSSVHVPVYQVQLQRTGSVLAEAGQCTCGRDAAKIVRRYIGEPDREHFIAIYLDPQLFVIGLQTVSIGGRCSVSVVAAEIFKAGLLCNATGVTLVHNHPSGRATPSRADCHLTTELEIAGMLVGIQVLDHVVLGNTDAVSMRDADLMFIPIASEFDIDAVLKGSARKAQREAQQRRRKSGTAAASASG